MQTTPLQQGSGVALCVFGLLVGLAAQEGRDIELVFLA